jgi:hypothetical protein
MLTRIVPAAPIESSIRPRNCSERHPPPWLLATKSDLGEAEEKAAISAADNAAATSAIPILPAKRLTLTGGVSGLRPVTLEFPRSMLKPAWSGEPAEFARGTPWYSPWYLTERLEVIEGAPASLNEATRSHRDLDVTTS